MVIRYTLVGDGTSDEALKPIIDWLLAEHCPNASILGTFARDLGPVGNGLKERVVAAIRNFPCDLLFVHRDAEGQGFEKRLSEIEEAVAEVDASYIPVVPVKMTEAWLLFDEMAIRSAAGNSAGKIDLELPNKKQWEKLNNAKEVLFDALCKATEKKGRALQKFSPAKGRGLVTRRSQDFSPLRGLPSFDFFEKSLVQQIELIGINALD